MRRLYKLYEEEVNNDNTSNSQKTSSNSSFSSQTASQQKIENMKSTIVAYKNQLINLKKNYENNKYTIQQKIIQLNKAIVDAGGSPVDAEMGESYSRKYKSSKAVFESAQISKVDELCAAIKSANDNAQSLSYYMDTRTSLSFARKLLAFLNDQSWNDGENHWEEFSDYFRAILIKSTASYSRREIDVFISEFKNILMNNTAYRWIFGR